ncbi:hypothetical protein IT402_02570 [Candidatus Nomurabacteria bacterium]|nr:hypothetical protein [Candidatus Nomurabacteria bacterium]
MKNIYKISSVLAIFVGVIMISGGIWGICFTYKNVARENIVTPEDSVIPNTPVRGPLTLKTQSDIIREHTLRTTGGKTYAEMPRQIQKLDENGNAVLNEKGEIVMIPNDARNMWVTATTLTTALNLAIVTYIFSGLVLLFGFISLWNGLVFFILSKKS